MLNRLSTQVFLVSIAVATVAAVLTGVLVRSRTVSAFEDAADRDLTVDSAIFNEVSSYPLFFSTWADAQDQLVLLANATDERIAITDLDGETVLADSDPGAPLPDEPATVVIADDFGLEINQVVFQTCLTEAGLVETGVIVGGVSEPFAIDGDDEFQRCIEAVQVNPRANALLFLGYSTEPLDLGSLGIAGLLLGGGGVMLVAAVGAVLLARRIAEPVRELTDAAALLEAGDLSQRVETLGSGEIGNLGATFNSMATRLERTEESRRRLIGDIAHELRNPIGALQGNLEAAQDGVLPIDDGMIAMLVSETHQLGQLVRDLQDITLAEHQGLRIDRESLDLLATCSEVVNSHAAIKPQVRLDCSGLPTVVNADPIRIRQVVDNLVRNAILHTPEGGTIEVRVSESSHVGIISVTDSGVGILPEDIPRVFDRFWRSDASRTRETGGSGLGLSISQAIVSAHGGTIEVASAPGAGSQFTVNLPFNPNKRAQ